MNSKYKIPIISVTVLAGMIAAVIYLSLSNRFNEPEKHFYIEFLNVNNHETDSVLNTLSLDDLIDKLFVSNDFMVNNGSNSVLKLIGNNQYIDAINDSTSVSNILLNIVNNNTKGCFFSFNRHELSDINDSNYVDFVTNKYNLYKNILNCNNILCGLKINKNQMLNLQKLALDTSSFAKYIYDEIVNKTDVVLVDSCNSIDHNLQIDGILIKSLNKSLTTDNEIIDLLNSNSNIFCTSSEQIPKLKLRVKQLIENDKYTASRLRSKIRKPIKFEIWRDKSKIALNKNGIINKKLMSQYFVEKSICLLNNQDSVLPLKNNYIDVFNNRSAI